MSEAAEEQVAGIERQVKRGEYGPLATPILQFLLTRLREVEGERDDIAFRVEHPEQTHLHYAACPYEPFADIPDWDIPEDRPDCTCGYAAKGAYWKGQWMLERGYHRLTQDKLAQAEQRVAGLEAALTNLVGELSDLQIEAVREGCGNTNAACLHLRVHEAKKVLGSALTPPPVATRSEE